MLNTLSSLALGLILITVVLQLSRFDPRLDIAVPQLGLPEQSVAGGETRVPLAPDGHYWVRATINGQRANFLIDTGATVSAVSPAIAEAAGLEPRRGGIPVQIKTANGSVAAEIATADRIAFGNIAAEGIDVVIAPRPGRNQHHRHEPPLAPRRLARGEGHADPDAHPNQLEFACPLSGQPR